MPYFLVKLWITRRISEIKTSASISHRSGKFDLSINDWHEKVFIVASFALFRSNLAVTVKMDIHPGFCSALLDPLVRL